MVELEAITSPNMYIQVFFHSIFWDFKQKLSLNLSDHHGIRSHHIVKHLQLSVKGLQHGESYLLSPKFEGRKSVLKCP